MHFTSLMHTLFFFVLALAVLIAFHEFGHFIAARKLGVKVLRFSIGFGTPLWRYRKSADDTEFTIGALPLGGYVKMVDEREGAVEAADLPFAFNRQSLLKRFLIVLAGPVFNLLLAVLIYWGVFMVGEPGIRPVLGPVAESTLAARAGFMEGDEILKVADKPTPTWNLMMSTLLEQASENENIMLEVRAEDDRRELRTITIARALAEKPDLLIEQLGFRPWQPPLKPLVDKVEPGSAAESAGLKPGDLLISVDGTAITGWQQWVDYVRGHPERELKLTVDRNGLRAVLPITPVAVDSAQGKIGRIGAGVKVPEETLEAMKVDYRLGVFPAFAAAVAKTADYSAMTVRMLFRMLIGRAGVENLSGPISIAQYAGQSASMGSIHFLKFIAIVSISLGVLNLMPVPVLDGGHLVFYLIEAAKGRPLSDDLQAICQQVGMFLLLALMVLAFFLDFQRLLA